MIPRKFTSCERKFGILCATLTVRLTTFSILASVVRPVEELRRNSCSSWLMMSLRSSDCPVCNRNKEPGLWLLKPRATRSQICGC